MTNNLIHVLIIWCVLGLSAVETVLAQPSGGPYGPVPKTFALPIDAPHIYYAAPDGRAENPGTELSKPTSLERAIERAGTNDAIILRGGIYRTGNLVVNQGITIQPYGDEHPIVKGTRVASEWKNLGNGVWSTKWTRLFPSKPDSWWQRDREGAKTPQYRFNNDMVFSDGGFLQAVGWEGELDEHSYCIDYETGTVYIGVDPAQHAIEITAFDAAIIRTTKPAHGRASDGKGYTLRGITFTQYAYRALEIEGREPERREEEALHGKGVVGTTIEDCTISYCSRVAGYFRGDHLTIRRCRITDTSTEGVYVIGSADVLLERNIFTRNNIEHITGYYPAAVKIFNQSNRVTCNDNLVIDLPNSNGIWYDVGNADGVFTNNWIEGVGRISGMPRTDRLWPSDNGFFFEISDGVVCQGNVFVDCDHGLMILNSAHARIARNTFVNSMACIGRDGRHPETDHFGWHSSTAPDIGKRGSHVFVNNLLAGDESFSRPLLFVWQPASMCERTPDPQLDEFDGNQFVQRGESTRAPMMLWSPARNAECQMALYSIEELHRAFPFVGETNRSYGQYAGPLFVSPELHNFRIVREFAGAASGAEPAAGAYAPFTEERTEKNGGHDK